MPPYSCTRGTMSVGALSDVMTIGTLCAITTSVSSSSRLLALLTIRLTANGATFRSGCSRRYFPSASSMRVSQRSSSSCGRAFSAGNEPMTPALHCSITRSGPDTMNIGAARTGMRRCSRS